MSGAAARWPCRPPALRSAVSAGRPSLRFSAHERPRDRGALAKHDGMRTSTPSPGSTTAATSTRRSRARWPDPGGTNNRCALIVFDVETTSSRSTTASGTSLATPFSARSGSACAGSCGPHQTSYAACGGVRVRRHDSSQRVDARGRRSSWRPCERLESHMALHRPEIRSQEAGRLQHLPPEIARLPRSPSVAVRRVPRRALDIEAEETGRSGGLRLGGASLAAALRPSELREPRVGYRAVRL